jgi:hypothetical protein
MYTSSPEGDRESGTVLLRWTQKKSLYSAFETLDIYTTSSHRDETLRSPPCPTCCTSREATVVISQRFILVYSYQPFPKPKHSLQYLNVPFLLSE